MTSPEVNFISSIRDKISADLPLPEGPEMMVKLPRSIFKLIPDNIGIDIGQEKDAFFTSNLKSCFWQFRVLYESTSGRERYSTSLLRLVKPLTRIGKVTGKIDRQTANCSQFHQHFTSSFCANIFVPKNYEVKP